MSHDVFQLEKSWGESKKISGTAKAMVDNDSDDEVLETNQNSKEEEEKLMKE